MGKKEVRLKEANILADLQISIEAAADRELRKCRDQVPDTAKISSCGTRDFSNAAHN